MTARMPPDARGAAAARASVQVATEMIYGF